MYQIKVRPDPKHYIGGVGYGSNNAPCCYLVLIIMIRDIKTKTTIFFFPLCEVGYKSYVGHGNRNN